MDWKAVLKALGYTGCILVSFIGALYVNFTFCSDIDTVVNEYPLQISPANWTFSIWIAVYLYQFIWIIYLGILQFKNNDHQILFNPSFYISFIISNFCNGIWIYLFSKATNNNTIYLLYSDIVLLILLISLYWCFIQSNITLLAPVQSGLLPDWVTNNIQNVLIGIIINGIAFYCTWISVACYLNAGIVFEYYAGLSDTAASFISLSCIGGFFLIYSIFDFVLFNYYLSYVYSPFPVLIITFAGIMCKNGVSTEYPATIMVPILLGLTVIVFIAKVAVNCVKSRRARGDGILDYGYDMAQI